MGTEHKCQWCGKEYESTCHKSRQKFCSAECRIKYHNAKRYYGGKVDVCPECGAPVEQSGERGRWRRFCSDRCRQEYHRKQRQSKLREQGHGKQVCPNCGIEFEVDWSCKTRRFCSEECRKEWWREYHKANPSREPGMRRCAFCGKEFSSDRWQGGEYCSRECAAAARHDPGHKRGMRRIRYTSAEDWKEQLHEASIKSPPPRRGKRVWLVAEKPACIRGWTACWESSGIN